MALHNELLNAIEEFRNIPNMFPNCIVLPKRKFKFFNKFIHEHILKDNENYIALSSEANRVLKKIKEVAYTLPNSRNLNKLFLSYILENLPKNDGDSVCLDINDNDEPQRRIYKITIENGTN